MLSSSTRKDTTLFTNHLRESVERPILLLSILTLSPYHRVPAIPEVSASADFSPTKWPGITLASILQLIQTCSKTKSRIGSRECSGGMAARTLLRLLHTYLSGCVKTAGTLTDVCSVTNIVEWPWKLGHPLWST